MTQHTPHPADDTQTDASAHDPHTIALAADADGLSAEQVEAALLALPGGLNLIALDNRLISTCWPRWLSRYAVPVSAGRRCCTCKSRS